MRAWTWLLMMLFGMAVLASPALARRYHPCHERCRHRAYLCKERCRGHYGGERRECKRACRLREAQCRAHCPY
jgi:hypothetical protein